MFPLLSISERHDTLAKNWNFESQRTFMKTGIHPTYTKEAVIICGCGATIKTGSTFARSTSSAPTAIRSIPAKKRIDSTGRVDRFWLKKPKIANRPPKARQTRRKVQAKSREDRKPFPSPRNSDTDSQETMTCFSRHRFCFPSDP